MITNKDIRVENGNLVLNGDKFPLDGQSPETIMEIVEDNSDTTPTENSTAPITSGGVYTALGTKQNTLTFDSVPTDASTNPVTSGGLYNTIGDLTQTGVTGADVAAQISNLFGLVNFKLLTTDLYTSWDDFPINVFGYGYANQTNHPGAASFVIGMGNNTVRMQFALAFDQSFVKYRTKISDTWSAWAAV